MIEEWEFDVHSASLEGCYKMREKSLLGRGKSGRAGGGELLAGVI